MGYVAFKWNEGFYYPFNHWPLLQLSSIKQSSQKIACTYFVHKVPPHRSKIYFLEVFPPNLGFILLRYVYISNIWRAISVLFNIHQKEILIYNFFFQKFPAKFQIFLHI